MDQLLGCNHDDDWSAQYWRNRTLRGVLVEGRRVWRLHSSCVVFASESLNGCDYFSCYSYRELLLHCKTNHNQNLQLREHDKKQEVNHCKHCKPAKCFVFK